MRKHAQSFKAAALTACVGALLLSTGCGSNPPSSQALTPASPVQPNTTTSPANPVSSANQGKAPGAAPESATKPEQTAGTSKGADAPSQTVPGSSQQPAANSPEKKNGTLQVVAAPAAITVMVNKSYQLPDGYKPPDLVEPDVAFVFKEHLEKRKMRKEAASALETLFAAAKKDGLPLAGVSAYRSYETQKTLYNNYVKKDGQAAADKYSARPGTSEHQTGLAIDVTGASGKCAAEDCFADTKEAKWLDQHASEYGFIIRYPKGKESITGYQYEPWHLRYVGKQMAADIVKKGLTLEEFIGDTVPVVKPK